MFCYTQIVIAFFVDILLFDETFTFMQLAIAFGILLVCMSVAYIRLRKMQKEHPEEIPDDLSSRSPAL
jgi:drug/metabolite transporter (DMT)-like permease